MDQVTQKSCPSAGSSLNSVTNKFIVNTKSNNHYNIKTSQLKGGRSKIETCVENMCIFPINS